MEEKTAYLQKFPVELKLTVPNLKKSKLEKTEIEYPFISKICRYHYLKEKKIFLVCSKAEIILYKIQNLEILTKKKLTQIFSSQPVKIFKLRNPNILMIVYNFYEILKISIEEDNSIKILKHIWCYDELVSPNEYRFSNMEGLSVFEGCYFLESLSSDIPAITKIETFFDKGNNVFKGNLKKIFEFNFILEDEETNMMTVEGNFLTSVACGLITVIDFSPRLRKVKRRVEIDIASETNFLQIRKAGNSEKSKKIIFFNNIDSEENQEEEEEEMSFDDVEVHEIYYNPENDSLVLTTENCKVMIIKEVFCESRRRFFSFFLEGAQHTFWISKDLEQNYLLTKNRSYNKERITELYIKINFEEETYQLKSVVNYEKFCHLGVSLTVYNIFDISDLFENQGRVELFCMDDEFALYDPETQEILKTEIYSAVNYFDFVCLNQKSGSKEDIYIFQAEDRAGLFFMELDYEKRKMNILKKFHVHSVEGCYSRTQSLIDQVHELEQSYIVVMKVKENYFLIFKFDKKTLEFDDFFEYQGAKGYLKDFESEFSYDEEIKGEILDGCNEVDVCFEFESEKKSTLKILLSQFEKEVQTLVIIQNFCFNSENSKRKYEVKFYDEKEKEFRFYLRDEKYFVRFDQKTVEIYEYEELLKNKKHQLEVFFNLGIFKVTGIQSSEAHLVLFDSIQVFKMKIYLKKNFKILFNISYFGELPDMDHLQTEIVKVKFLKKDQFILVAFNLDYAVIDLRKGVFEWIMKHRPILSSEEHREWAYFNFLKFDDQKLCFYEVDKFLEIME